MFLLCKRRRRRRSSPIQWTREELERSTDIYFADSEMSDYLTATGDEACMTEGDKFIGTTAKFVTDWTILPLRPDLRPKK
jgi:hypothetical protein